MGQSISGKIISDKIGRTTEPGEIIRMEYDLASTHDGSTPGTKGVLNSKFGFEDQSFKIADPDRIAIIPDHNIPAHNEISQRNYTICKEVAEAHGIEKFYPQRDTGLMHAVVPEDGLVKPGDFYVAADSHTATAGAIGVYGIPVSYTDMAFAWLTGWTYLRVPETIRIEYHGELSEWVRGKDLILETIGRLGFDGAVNKAMEFGGPAIEALPMDDRFSITNMTIEAGAQTGFVEPDEITRDYVNERVDEDFTLFESDRDAAVDDRVEINCSEMEPRVSVPHNPENVKPISEVEGTEIDQSVVGSCTNCREEDLKQAAAILEDRRIDPGVRMIITPGTQQIQTKAYDEGWMQIFHEAGANIGSPGCGACFGRHIGALTENEVCIATTNRNFIGRMGPKSSEVYLSNPSVAAASAITGEITHPEKVV